VRVETSEFLVGIVITIHLSSRIHVTFVMSPCPLRHACSLAAMGGKDGKLYSIVAQTDIS